MKRPWLPRALFSCRNAKVSGFFARLPAYSLKPACEKDDLAPVHSMTADVVPVLTMKRGCTVRCVQRESEELGVHCHRPQPCSAGRTNDLASFHVSSHLSCKMSRITENSEGRYLPGSPVQKFREEVEGPCAFLTPQAWRTGCLLLPNSLLCMLQGLFCHARDHIFSAVPRG